MEKRKNDIPPWALAMAAFGFLSGGWLMAFFPVLIFLGVAPLMSLSERGERSGASIFEKMELVLLALGGALLVRALVHDTPIVSALAEGILLTLCFVAYVWIRKVLGSRTGTITLAVLWLAAEYVILKTVPQHGTFLADSTMFKPSWLRWNTQTGYLGGSLWILLVNWVFYHGFLRHGVNGFWATIGILMLGGPIAYSYSLDDSPILREEMINLYQNKVSATDVTYLARGELIVRTAAWLSALILLFTFVRQQTRK